MAAERQKQHPSDIEEGWSEVDDNHSVRSLSTSGDESDGDGQVVPGVDELTLSPAPNSPQDASANASALPRDPPPYSPSTTSHDATYRFSSSQAPPQDTRHHCPRPSNNPHPSTSNSPILKPQTKFAYAPQAPREAAASSSSSSSSSHPPPPPEFTLDQLDQLDTLAQPVAAFAPHFIVDGAPEGISIVPPFAPYARDGLDQPCVYLGALRHLSKTLLDVADETRYRVDSHASFRVPTVYKIQDTMNSMLHHLQELDPLLEAYTTYWSGGRVRREAKTVPQAGDIPINGGMLEWLDDVHQCLIMFQERIQEQIRSSPRSSSSSSGYDGRSMPTPAMVGAVLDRTAVDLERLQRSMPEFLPLFPLEYAQFPTNQAVLQPDSRDKYGSGSSSSDEEIGHRFQHPMRDIRRPLIDLKEHMLKLLVLLCELRYPSASTSPAPDAAEQLTPANVAMTNLIAVINILLDPSDRRPNYVDLGPGRDPRRVISQTALAALSPEFLGDVAAQLGQISAELDVRNDPAVRNNKCLIHSHQMTMLIEGGQLQELLSTTSFLEYLLMPEPEPEM